MPGAYLVGAGQSDFGSFPDESYRSLFTTAYENALESVPAGLTSDEIDEAYIGTLGISGETGWCSPRIRTAAGAFGVAIVRFEHDGERVSLPGQLIETAAAGDRVVSVIRHIHPQERIPRYGAKFIPETR